MPSSSDYTLYRKLNTISQDCSLGGSTGPMGPIGPPGATGQIGSTGHTGATGHTGSNQ